jgi:hypothetical protein
MTRLSLPLLLSLIALAAGCGRSGIVTQTDAGLDMCAIDADCQAGTSCIEGVCTFVDELCVDDADCPGGRICREGTCVTETVCTENSDCPPSERCDEGVCRPIGTCVDDAGCPDYAHCVDGICVQNPPCESDLDCPLDEQCVDGGCVPRDECTNHLECPPDELCQDGLCFGIGDCSDDGDCPPFASCVDGTCTQNDACTSDDECPADMMCGDDGLCVPRPSCTDSTDCDATEHCENGLCQPIGTCVDDSDCPPYATCIDGVCAQNAGCTTDADCPATEECTDGLCTDRPPCDDSLDCDADELCVDGQCTALPLCTDDDDCPLEAHCESGQCVQNDACTTDLDCPSDSRCDDGLCVRIGDCVEHADCGPGNICEDGTCVRAPCESAAECDDGLFCNGVEQCDPIGGCVGGAAPALDDGIGCTTGTCDEAADAIVQLPVDSLCVPTNACTVGVCVVGTGCTFPADDTLVPPQTGPTNDCRSEVCAGGIVVSAGVNNGEVPAQVSTTDCKTEICSGGDPISTNNSSETPLQVSLTDCQKQVCSNGSVVTQNDNNETPTQTSSSDCVTNICLNGAVSTTPNNNEAPAQASANDCRTNVCNNGVVSFVAKDTEVPPVSPTDCLSGACSGGNAVYSPSNGLCTDGAQCEQPSCAVDGSCDYTPDDALCAACPGQQVEKCLPNHAGALATGCVCLTPASLTCSANPTVGEVLTSFALTATATNAQAGSTFAWDIAGVPVGSSTDAHVLTNAASASASFTPTFPSANASDRYTLRVTLQEPYLPPQTCQVLIQATPLPDTFEVTLFMTDALDVDVHVAGGQRTDNAEFKRYDMPFHPLHDPLVEGDDPDRNCSWANCPVCTIDIPGQPVCTPITPRVVDFDDPADGASLVDVQDPQLDIDNRRGCFTTDSGDLSCVPEKVTVETPDAGVYFVWPYLYGDPLSVTPGLISTPSATSVEIEVKCRGVSKRYTRVLSSIVQGSSPPVAAATESYERLGGVDGFVRFVVPASGPCVLP